MRRHGWFLLLAAISLVLVGCGQPSGTGTEENGAPGPQANLSPDSPQQPGKPRLEGPAGAVQDFLEAIRTGDDAVADRMLTSVARQQARERGMGVHPPGSDTLRFEVGKAEMLPDDRAQVPCKWTDREDDGTVRTHEVIWVLRKESEGWRIGGMAATVFPELPPYRFNFEDLDDLVRTQEAVNAERDRREAAARAQAKQMPAAEDPIRR